MIIIMQQKERFSIENSSEMNVFCTHCCFSCLGFLLPREFHSKGINLNKVQRNKNDKNLTKKRLGVLTFIKKI